MKKTIAIVLISLLSVSISQQLNAVTVHTIGDSTMANYDEGTTDKRGWGMMFQQFFTSDVTINNRGKSGASSKSFYKEAGYWNTVKTQIKAGDYVFVQFAHNDEKNGGLDGDTVIAKTDPLADYRGTTAQGTFKFYLRAYINESRALGATPVLVTPMCRKYFSGNTITRTGRHDLGGNFGLPESDHTHDYVWAMKEVATEMNVQLIDLTEMTKNLYLSYGDQACTELLFCKDDSTHPNALGGTLVARLCAQAMVTQNILAQYVKASSDVLVNPGDQNFGKAYNGQTLTKEFTVSGFDLNPAAGTFSLSVSEGFKIALNKTDTYSPSINLTYANGNLDFTRFYVAINLTSPGIKTGLLTITNGTITKTVPLTAECIELTGGKEVKVKWELSANQDFVLTGPASPVGQTFSGMYIQRYAVPNAVTTWPAGSGYDATRKMQRDVITGDAWPAGEIDEVSTRYIQFGITANPGSELNIDSIGLYVCGAGGNGMRCRVSYSTNKFATYTVIGEFTSMVANTVYAVSSIPVLKLSGSDTLLLRVYPWYNGAATGKTICLADVTIHGMATVPNAVKSAKTNSSGCFVKEGELIIPGITEKSDIQIINIQGKQISRIVTDDNSDFKMKVPDDKGVYFCVINTKKGREIYKFLVL
jgi:lysophospholipase L1-like esterase